MGKGSDLTQFEIGKIIALKDEGKSLRNIAEQINRSKSTVANYLSNPSSYRQNNRAGRPSILSDRDRHHVLRAITIENKTINEAKRELNLNCSKSTVWRAARNGENIDFKKVNSKSPLSPLHQEIRLNFAKKFIDYKDNWMKVMFSNEKNSISMVLMVIVIHGST